MSEKPKSRRRTVKREIAPEVTPPTVETDLSAALIAERPEPAAARKPLESTPNPTLRVAMPTGPIRTRNPKGGSFGTDWSQVTRWAPQVVTACEEDGAPDPVRGLAHIVIESQGLPAAIQRNDDNGWSYGLMQVVPRYWRAEIGRLAGRTFATEAAAGQAMIDEPSLAIRAGVAVLASYHRQFGTWDAASSGFFTGKSNWSGADSVNGTRGGDYRRCLNELIKEIGSTSGAVITPPPEPPRDTDPYRLIMGGDYPAIDYGWLSDVGLDFYGYGVGHGTQRSTQHTGDDIVVPVGTPLYAPAPGVVGCVGQRGQPQPGRSCGSYADTGGGPGNLTIKLDGEVWLTLGHVREAFVGTGDRVRTGQKVATVGHYNGAHVHIECSILKNGTYLLLNPKPTLAGLLGAAPATDPRADWVRHEVSGFPRGLLLPPWIKVAERLTPRGRNRSGAPLAPVATVFHETGNRRLGADARDHAQWQADGTPGHPDGKIGVHAYIEDDLIVITLPFDEQGVHSGDARNRTMLGLELCVNADRNAELSELTAQHLHAAVLCELGKSAADAMWSHTTTACPAIINGSGRWQRIEAAVDALIAGGGPGPTPLPTYAKPVPLPFAWAGEDVEHNGQVFYALHRNFHARREAKAYQYATLGAAPVRRPLPRGEAAEIQWAVKSEGRWWLISRFATRLLADDFLPALDFDQFVAGAEPVSEAA